MSPRWVRPFPALACLLLFAASFSPPIPTSEPGIRGYGTGTPQANGSAISASVLVNGASTATADSVSSALAVTFSRAWDINVTWSARGGKFGTPEVRDVARAEIQLFYLGSPIISDQTVSGVSAPASSGAFEIKAGSVVQLQYLMEGTYESVVRLLDSNGSSVWSTNFFVHATAPYHLTAFSIGLVALILATLASAARSLPRSPKTGRPEPKTPEKSR